MSHVSTYGQKIKDLGALQTACEELGFEFVEGEQTVQQYGRNAIQAVASFRPKGWKYSIAVTEEGEVQYDHWGSQSDTMQHLGRTLQRTNQISIENECWDKSITTETLENGDLRMIIEI